MLGIDAKAARYVWTAAAVVLLLYLVYLIRRTLFIFILAVLLAYLISPLVNLLDRYLPASRTRTPALALAYIIAIGIVVFLGIKIGTTVVDQAKTLEAMLPGYDREVAGTLRRALRRSGTRLKPRLWKGCARNCSRVPGTS